MPEIDPVPQRPRSGVTFPLAVILSVHHNKMLVTFTEFRDLLDYVTGVQVALWEIPRARAQVAAHLARQYVWLRHIDLPPGFRADSGNANRYVKGVAKAVGCDLELEVRPMRKGMYQPLPGSQMLRGPR